MFSLLYETSKYHNSMLLTFNDFRTSIETSLISQDGCSKIYQPFLNINNVRIYFNMS